MSPAFSRRGCFVSYAVGLIISSRVFAAPLLSPDDTKFFHDHTARIVQAARLASGETSTGETNTTPYAIYTPDAPRVYAAFFPRDSNMTLGADFISLHDVEGWIKLMAATIPKVAWQVRPGIRVPAYSLPDHIYYNGLPAFFPGPARGDDQGGGSFGPNPPLDDPYFFLFTVCQQADMAHNVDFFRAPVSTPTGLPPTPTTQATIKNEQMPLSELCLKVFDASPTDPATGLVMTGPIDSDHNAHDFGFCDGVFKSGKLLFTSVLRYDAATRLAPFYRKIGDAKTADRLLVTAAQIKKNLAPNFYHETAPGEGLLHSATDYSNQPDVWGSAYAVAIGAVDAKTSPMVARALLRGYQDHSLVIKGWVTQVLPKDPAHPNGWMNSTCKFGEYQNGGYWGTGTGWYILALNTIDPAAAKAMTQDFVDYAKASLDSAGTTQAWEVINDNWTGFQHPGYLATVAFPYGLLARAGLLPPTGVLSQK